MNPIIIRIEDYNKEELVIQYILVIFKNLNCNKDRNHKIFL